MHDIYQWWKIAPYSYIKDELFRSTLYDEGYYVDKKLPESTLNELEKLYNVNHNFRGSGMFNTIYSKDVAFRKGINKEITDILNDYLSNNYQGYKVLYSVFFLKGPSTKAFLFMHQDLNMVDESKHSAIHLWIPLTDITANNGALSVIDKSHHIYAPFRGMSFPDPTSNIQDYLAQYLKPMLLRKGEVLAFDPRTIHCSLPNKTKDVRPVVIVVLAPKEASIEVSYQDPVSKKIEIIEQEDDFFMTSHHFVESSKERPSLGIFKAYTEYQPHYYTTEEFEQLAQKFKIEKKYEVEKLENVKTEIHRNPNAKKKSILSKWFQS